MSGTLTGRVRANLAVNHLLSAAMFSRRVGKVEAEHAGEKFSGFYDEILPNASACVLLTTASLEAYANEMFINREKHLPDIPEVAMNAIWRSAERATLSEKFDLFAQLKSAPAVGWWSKSPAQDIQALVKLRNALTHFRPEWDDEQVSHDKLARPCAGGLP
jgi:hypothetical protein